MGKSIITGFLLGIGIGVLLYFIFPQMLLIDLLWNSLFRQQLGLPVISTKGLDIGESAFFIGIIGGFLGFTTYKIRKYGHKR